MTYIPKVRPDTQGTQWQRKLTAAAYWSDGWELRRLDWLRWHGLWPPRSLSATTAGMMGLMNAERAKVPRPNLVALVLNAAVIAILVTASALEAAYGRYAFAAFEMVLIAVNVALGACNARVITRLRASARRPDYALIAAMEREIYGETFRHDGAPEQGGFRSGGVIR